MLTLRGQALTIFLVVICSFTMYNRQRDHKYISTKSYPVDAANYILEEAEKGHLDLSTMKMFNDYNYGSYLLFRGIPVFIDSRADLYSPEFNEGCNAFSDYLAISGITTFYDDKLDEYGITHVMSYKNSKLTLLLAKDENYKVLYQDDNFVFFERLNVKAKDGE